MGHFLCEITESLAAQAIPCAAFRMLCGVQMVWHAATWPSVCIAITILGSLLFHAKRKGLLFAA